MFGKKTVKNYRGKKEYLVLSMVKKYPLYSVNKLTEELPGISRHSVQRILEKHDLSTAEKRLDFSSEKEFGLFKTLQRLKITILGLFWSKQIDFEGVKKLLKRFQAKPKLRWQLARNLAIFLGLVLIFWQGASFISARPPEISLDQPEMGFVNEGERLFISGKVIPASSQVTVNGNEVSLNGDGSFTAVVNIPLGESTLEIEAVNKKKEAKALRLVKRVLTQEEIQAEEEEEAKKKLAATDKAAELERTVNDLLAAKNANSGSKGFLRILNNHVKEEAGFQSVVGEVFNFGQKEVSWVMVTVKFLNQSGGVVDTKYGFATGFEEIVKPGEGAEFETQPTKKEFDYYSLELSWEEGVIAGAATEAEEEATPSGEIEEETESQ